MNVSLHTKELGAVELDLSRISLADTKKATICVEGFAGPLHVTRVQEMKDLLKQMHDGITAGDYRVNPNYIVAVHKEHGFANIQGFGQISVSEKRQIDALQEAQLEVAPDHTALLGSETESVSIRLDRLSAIRSAHGAVLFQNGGGVLRLNPAGTEELLGLEYWARMPDLWRQLTMEQTLASITDISLADRVRAALGPEMADQFVNEDDDAQTLIISEVEKAEADFRLENFEAIKEDLGMEDVTLEKDGENIKLVKDGEVIGTISHNADDKQIRLALADAFAKKDEQGLKTDAFYKTVAYFQFGQVVVDDDLKLLKKDVAAIQKDQVLNPENRPKTLKQARTGQAPKPSSLHSLMLRGLKTAGKGQDSLRPINFEALNRLLNELSHAAPEDRARLTSAAAGSLRYDPVRQKVDVAPWIKAEARRIQHPALGRQYSLHQRDAAQETLDRLKLISPDRDRTKTTEKTDK